MNQADILKAAEQSGFIVKHWPTGWVIYAPLGSDGIAINNELTRFAELVAQHEREAILAIDDSAEALGITEESLEWSYQTNMLFSCAANGISAYQQAIRARGTK